MGKRSLVDSNSFCLQRKMTPDRHSPNGAVFLQPMRTQSPSGLHTELTFEEIVFFIGELHLFMVDNSAASTHTDKLTHLLTSSEVCCSLGSFREDAFICSDCDPIKICTRVFPVEGPLV